MAYTVEQLQAARDLALTRLSEMLASPKPDYEVDGQRFSWTQYQRILNEQIEFFNKQLERFGGAEDGPGVEETTVL